MDNKQLTRENIVTPELYFLISKFLAAGPLQETAKVLIKELEQKKVLPRRTDWLGNEHDQSFDELESKYSHIGANHLLEICCRIGPILDNELTPAVPGIVSLLGSGRQSLLRTKESIFRPRSLLDYCTRIHGVSLPDSAITKPVHNIDKVLIGREYGGPVRRKLVIPTSLYSKTKLLRRTVGHLSSVYCVLFDRTGQYIITGADDLLIKIWSAIDGRLLATLRGASAEITDIAINLDNTMLAAGSLDRILRVWDLQTTSPIAVLSGHTGMITSVNFCPSPRGDLKYLVTTSTDGSIAFWQYTTPRVGKTIFAPKPIQYHEKLRPGQAQMMCTSFSPGGMFLAAGSADHHARVYIMSEDGPKRILETEAYTDAVDSVQWAHRGLKFISGSKDGTAHVWTFESQQWKSLKLNMTERLATCPEPEEGKKLKVTMVAWDCSDKYVITAVNDFTIKIWHSRSGKLHCVLRGHKDELYVLESNPKDEYVLLSAGHDGQVFLWDIEQGISVAHFVNHIDGQGHGGVFDAKWSPDGTMIAATDSHGHILIFGLGIGPDRFKNLPTELFFHTDYRPLLRDAQHYVVDEQTQIMPHLMPPPFLVDVDGNPHPPTYQRLVPGRENCPTDQLVPNITMGIEGVEIDDNGGYSHIDRLIEALANRQGQDPAPDSNNDRSRNNSHNANGSSSRGASAIGRAAAVPRRAGDVEGVRQSSGNWQRETNFKFIRRIYVRPMKYSQLQNLRQTVYAAGQYEMEQYKREMRRRPIMINTSNANTALQTSGRQRGVRNARRGRRPAYHTRAVRGQEHREEPPEEEEEEEESSNSSGDTSYSNVEENLSEEDESSTTDSESSDYSDWVADKPGPNLEPPKRSKRKPVTRRSSSGSSDETSQPNTSSAATKSRRKRPAIPETASGEIPEAYKPPEWLSEVIPRKTPYYPQMGDEVVYFRQGHQRYLDAVRSKKAYKLTHSSEPWNFRELREHELVRVIGIKYEIRPPRLCCLKLAMLDEDGNMSGVTFKIKYHDMPDVLDFLVLRQTFDLAVQRNWSIGDRFRCMIGDGWWMGQIESRHLLSPEYPNSYFMCFRVRWDNGEYEYMSPWDMEPIDESRLPEEVGGAVPVLPEEIRATLYQPKSEEWHRGDRDGSCRRIINGLEQVMRLSIAEPFLAPVDLNIYPNYAYLIEYPIDLTTIKSRFENHFYRRITSAQFDVRYLATNAEKFNRKHTNIVRHARIITDLCLRIIREQNDIDVAAVYHQLVDIYISSESENENDNEAGPSTSTAGPSCSNTSRRSNGNSRSSRSQRTRSGGDWRSDCRQLLDMMWLRPDSTPFREPVDTMQFPDYLQIIDTPMDLRTVKEDLLGGNYEDPLDFAKDVRLIFQNSRNYNTNKRSRIYSMTLRLSALFETHIKLVISNWKAARRRANISSPKRTPPDRSRNRSGPSTRAKTTNGRTNNHHSSDDDDDVDDDAAHCSTANGRQHRNNNRQRLPRNASGATTFSSNRVTSSNQNESLPGPSGHNLRRNASRPNSQEINGNSSSESSTLTSDTSSSSEDDSDSHDDNQGGEGRRVSRKVGSSGAGGAGASTSNRNKGNDSEDSYKPNDRRGGVKRRKAQKNNREAKRSRRIDSDDGENSGLKRNKRIRGNTKRTSGGAVSVNKRKQRRKDNTSEDNEEQAIESEHEVVVPSAPQTPKRGRPPKNASQPSTSAAALAAVPAAQEQVESPSRATRISSRRTAAETDHSYHLPVRNSRSAIVDSETEQETARPTRSSTRRAILEWARGSAEEDEEQDDDEDEPIVPTRSRANLRAVKKTSDSSQDVAGAVVVNGTLSGPSTSRGPILNRQLRTNRNTHVLFDEDDDDESDNEPLASNQNHRRQKLVTEHISQSGAATRGVRLPIATNYRTRSNTTNQDTMPSSSSVVLRNAATTSHHQVQVDHNYDEPGPSTIRNTRRVLSRHQRNADELDLDPLDMPNLFGNVSSRLRIRNNVNSTTPIELPAPVIARRRGRQRYSQEASTTEPDVEDDEDGVAEEAEEDSGGSDEGTDGNSKDSDSEDNQPLTSYVSSRRQQPQNPRSAATSNRRPYRRMRQRRKRHINTDGDDEEAEHPFDDDDDEEYQTRPTQRGSRNTRNQKRPRYNEDSDDTADSRARRRVPLRHANGNLASIAADSNDDEADSDNNEHRVSVSSRGRVRKISAKARGIFRD